MRITAEYDKYHALWEKQLLAGYEMVVGGGDGEGQLCGGDSGGPLLAKSHGVVRVYGVGSFNLTGSDCNHGGAYASFGRRGHAGGVRPPRATTGVLQSTQRIR